MATAPVNGITISYTDSGGDGPAVVLSHGYLMDSSMFEPQVAALAPEYRVISWDERGFGGTRATGPFTYWDSASDVIGLLDHLGIEQAVLGGMSQGGFLSLRAALLAPAGCARSSSSTARPVWRTRRPRPRTSRWSRSGWSRAPSRSRMWWRPSSSASRMAPSTTSRGSPDGQRPTGRKLRLAFRCLMDRDDITDRLGEISCPALILHGTADAAIPMERAEMVQAGLAGPASLVQVEDGSHAANLSHPDQVNVAILEFLRSLP